VEWPYSAFPFKSAQCDPGWSATAKVIQIATWRSVPQVLGCTPRGRALSFRGVDNEVRKLGTRKLMELQKHFVVSLRGNRHARQERKSVHVVGLDHNWNLHFSGISESSNLSAYFDD